MSLQLITNLFKFIKTLQVKRLLIEGDLEGVITALYLYKTIQFVVFKFQEVKHFDVNKCVAFIDMIHIYDFIWGTVQNLLWVIIDDVSKQIQGLILSLLSYFLVYPEPSFDINLNRKYVGTKEVQTDKEKKTITQIKIIMIKHVYKKSKD